MPPSGSRDPLRGTVVAASVLGGLGVLLGAFGAHGLEGRVTPDRLATFETAVRYHLIHAVALLALAGVTVRRGAAPPAADGSGAPGPGGGLVPVRTARRVATLWILGTTVFSGSLYLLVLLDLGILGAVTPLGGILLVTGWGWLALDAIRGDGEPRTP